MAKEEFLHIRFSQKDKKRVAAAALEQLLPKTSADAPGAPTGDDRVNPSADAKLDPTVGACLPPSQLLLFPEVLRRPLEFTQC